MCRGGEEPRELSRLSWIYAGLFRLRPGLVMAPRFKPGRGGGSAQPFNSTNSLEKLGAVVAFASCGKVVAVEGAEGVAEEDYVASGFQPCCASLLRFSLRPGWL